MEDPVSGKIKWQNPKNLKKIGWGALIVIGAFVMIYQLSKTNINLFTGDEDYREELKNKVGIVAEEIQATDELGDPLERYKKNKNDGSENNLLKDSLNPNGPLDFGVCVQLLDKLKVGSKLNFDERIILKRCLDQNISNLAADELSLAKALANDALLSEADKKLLTEMFGSDKTCQDEVNTQVKTNEGNDLINRMVEDPSLNQALVELLQNQDTLRQAVVNPEALRSKLGMTGGEFVLFQKLLEKCNPETLLRMLSDPKYKEVLQKLLKAALEDPDFLNKSGLTDEERALLQEFMKGTIPSDSPDYEIAQALMGGDANKKALAQDILKARALGDNDLAGALTGKLTGAEMDEAMQALAKNYSRDALAKAYDNKDKPDIAQAYLNQAKGIPLTAEQLAKIRSADDLGVDPNDKKALFEALSQDLANRQAEIDRLRQEVANAQADARSGAKKLSDGLILSPEEQAALQRFSDLQKKIAEMEAKQKLRQQQIAKEMTDMQSLVNRLGKTVKQIYPTGLSGDLAAWTKCDDSRPFTIVRKKSGGKKRGETFLTPDGKELTPEQIQLLKAYRLAKAENDQNRANDKESLLNPNASLLRNSVALNSQRAGGEKGGAGGIQQLFISDAAKLVPFKLTPNMSIAGVLLTELLVSDKGSGQKVRVKFLQDVYDPKTNKLVIPKNSIAFGSSGQFDVDTQSMNLSLESVAVGGNIMQVPFSISSADLSPGLKGEIRDTRGKLLFGAFISAFSAGALGAVSQNFIAPYRQSTDIADNLTGAGLQGTAEVAQRIAEMYAGDLQNAARIFYVPAGVKVVLTPN